MLFKPIFALKGRDELDIAKFTMAYSFFNVTELMAVYFAIGLQQRALDAAMLDLKLHPEALHSLLDIAEAHSKVDKRTTKELLGRILETDPQNQRALEILRGIEGE